MKHSTPWLKVKADYLSGVKPKELAIKYNLTPKQISDKANKDKWVTEKSQLSENLRESLQDKIDDGTVLAINTLVELIKDDETENNVKVQASKAILEISGLKQQRIDGVGGITNVVVNCDGVSVE